MPSNEEQPGLPYSQIVTSLRASLRLGLKAKNSIRFGLFESIGTKPV